MKKKLVIFGAGQIAELAHYYFSTLEEYEISAFCVDQEYITEDSFAGLPVVPFETIETSHPSSEYTVFVAISYSQINLVRREKFERFKAMGYTLASYISPHATILNDGNIGENCFIQEDNTVQPFVKIGDNVTLWSGNHIGHHSEIGDHTFISSHVVVSGGVSVGQQCFIGVNSTLRDGITIGDRCVIGAGTLILKNCDPDGLYIGTRTERSSRPSNKLKKI